MTNQYKHEPRTVTLVPKESDAQQSSQQRMEDLEQQIKVLNKKLRKLEVMVDALTGAVDQIKLNK